MGIKEWLKSGPTAQFGPLTNRVFLYRDRVELNREAHPLAGVTARVEKGSDIATRVTATRLVALGVFALAVKKKSGGEVFLTVEGPEFFWTVEVDRKQATEARSFAARVNDASKKASTTA